MIGFIGLGRMGAPMLRHLLDAGLPVSLTARRRESLAPDISGRAIWCDSPAELARACNTVFTIVGGPDDVRELYLGKAGLLANAAAGTMLIDMTTSSPELAGTLYRQARKRSLAMLDAPVTGGVRGAEAAGLTFMVGGDADALARAMVLLRLMGSTVVHIGGAGSGQLAKACNQVAVAGIAMGLAEALRLAGQGGAPPAKVFEVLRTGTASGPLMKRLGRKMLEGDGDVSFSMAHFIKDLTIAAGIAPHPGRDIPVALQCLESCAGIVAESGAEATGLQALHRPAPGKDSKDGSRQS